MSLGRKTLLIASLALAGLGGLLYAALANILSTTVQEEMVVSYVAVAFVVAGGGFFLVTLLMMNQLVLSRLAHLNATIGAISGSGDFSKRLQVHGRDELAGLAVEINNMLRTLQEFRQVPQKAWPALEKQDFAPPAPENPGIIPLPLQGAERPDSDPLLANPGELVLQAFRSVPVAFAVATAEGRLREVNESFLNLLGLQREAVLGQPFSDLDIWADVSIRERWLKLLQQKQPVRELECRLRSRSGAVRETLASVAWLTLADEPCFLFAACDITDRLNQEVQLRQTDKMEAVGQLSAGFAHDFNNILAIVQGYTSLLLADKALDPQANKALKEVSAAAERAAGLTRQLLIFSRKQFMQPKILDLNRLLQGLESTLQRLLGESSALKYNLAADAPPIRADAAMVEQVIVNLAVNARESMPRGGQLAISTAVVDVDQEYVRRKPEGRVGRFNCVTVTDTGCGFEPATLSRIFEPFFSNSGTSKGLGLGLATVYGIVKQHNGWLEVNSQPGQGTTFKIFLPSETKTALLPKAAPPGVPGGKERILLVEDEPGLCAMVEGILRRYGYTVVTAPNGVDAMQLWKQQKGEFDLLLTDMVMPEGLTGRQLAEKLRAQNPALKVIYSSGYSVDLVSDEGLDLSDGLNFLQKPYHPQKLAQTVRACLDAAVEKPALAEAVA